MTVDMYYSFSKASLSYMKTLHLIRHAKSSWENPNLADTDRPLSKRGIQSCKLMAPHILAAGCLFGHVYSSPALRARSTISLISGHLPHIEIHWKLCEALYCFHQKEIRNWCRDLSDDIDDVVIIGHNPALLKFCNKLSDRKLDNLPTCSYVQLTNPDLQYWNEMTWNTFRLMNFLKPKDFIR